MGPRSSELPALTSEPMARSKGRVVRKKPASAKKASKAPSRVKDAIAPTPKPLVLRRVRAKQGPDGQPARVSALHRVRVTTAASPARCYITACRCGRAPGPACKQSLIVEFKARHYEDYKERATRAQARILAEQLSWEAARSLKLQLGE